MLQYLTESYRKTVRRLAPWKRGGDDNVDFRSINTVNAACRHHHFGARSHQAVNSRF